MKFSLNRREFLLVTSSEFILMKNGILKTVVSLLEDVAGTLTELPGLAEYDGGVPAKISKGEQYKGLPYVILDYPRQFKKTEIFAIRNLFWWGNFFSTTLHLSGEYVDRFEDTLSKGILSGEFNGWYITCNSEAAWIHDVNSTCYFAPVERKEYSFADSRFIKLVKKIPLEEWDNTQKYLVENVNKLLSVLNAQAPMR